MLIALPHLFLGRLLLYNLMFTEHQKVSFL